MYLCYKGETKPHGSIIVDKGILFEDPEQAYQWAYELTKGWSDPADSSKLPIIPECPLSCYEIDSGEFSKFCFVQYIKIGEPFNISYHEYSIKGSVTEPIKEHIDKVFRELNKPPLFMHSAEKGLQIIGENQTELSPEESLRRLRKAAGVQDMNRSKDIEQDLPALHNAMNNNEAMGDYSESVQNYSDVYSDEPSSQEWAKIPKEERKLYRNDESNFEGWKKVLAERKEINAYEEKLLSRDFSRNHESTHHGAKQFYKDMMEADEIRKRRAKQTRPPNKYMQEILDERQRWEDWYKLTNNTGIFNP